MSYRAWDLPKSVEGGDRTWEIRSDYRAILTIITAFEDPDLTPPEKQYTALRIFYPQFEKMPKALYKEAYDELMHFIDHGAEEKDKKPPHRVMDWEQDANILFPAVNKVAGTEVRALDYLHWWTFLGYFMEVHGGVFGTVLQLRQKKAKHKKLEKEEQEFWRANRDLCELKPKLSKEEEEEKARLKALLGG